MSEYNPYAILHQNTEDFLVPASRNINNAKIMYQNDPYSNVSTQTEFCFLVQQAIEKTLKEIMVLNGFNVNSRYRTHSIAELVNIVETQTDFGRVPYFIEEKSYLIESWAVDIRYRDDEYFVVEYTEQIDEAYNAMCDLYDEVVYYRQQIEYAEQ